MSIEHLGDSAERATESEPNTCCAHPDEAENWQTPRCRSPRTLGTRFELPQALKRLLPALQSGDPSAVPEPGLALPQNQPFSQRLEGAGRRVPREQSRDRTGARGLWCCPSVAASICCGTSSNSSLPAGRSLSRYTIKA